MFALFNLASQALLYLTPLVVLPISLSIDYYLLLRISFIFASFHLLWGSIQLILKNKLNSIAWLFEIPFLALYGFILYNYLPHFIEVVYGNIIQWSGPALLLFEGIQIVRIIMHISFRLVTQMHKDESYEPIIKGVIIVSSIIAFIIDVIIVYNLFHHPYLTTGLASYLSILCTILVVLLFAALFFVESGIISDVAFVSLFVLFVARNAVLETPVNVPNTSFFESSFHLKNFLASSAAYFTSFSTQNAVSSIFTGSAKLFNLNQFFTFDFIVSSVLAVSSVLSFPYFGLNNIDTEVTPDYIPPSDDDDETTLIRTLQKSAFGTLFIMFYTHILLTATGNIVPSGTTWRIVQSIVTLGFYCYRLYVSSHSDAWGEKED